MASAPTVFSDGESFNACGNQSQDAGRASPVVVSLTLMCTLEHTTTLSPAGSPSRGMPSVVDIWLSAFMMAFLDPRHRPRFAFRSNWYQSASVTKFEIDFDYTDLMPND
jgi:hypothetical protein